MALATTCKGSAQSRLELRASCCASRPVNSTHCGSTMKQHGGSGHTEREHNPGAQVSAGDAKPP
eukprot:1158731-Pelagomonas_calceolata.AAC.10